MGQGTAPADVPSIHSYARSVGQILWVFVALSALELVVVHFLLSFWSPTAAALLSVITLITIVWLVRLILSFRRLPVTVALDGITFRTGTLRPFRVPAEAIAGVRRDVRPEDVRSRSVADFALIEHPNVVLDIAPPLPRGKVMVRAATHKLDDPDAFVRAVLALLQSRQPG